MGKPGLRVGAPNSQPDGPSDLCKRTLIESVGWAGRATDMRELKRL